MSPTDIATRLVLIEEALLRIEQTLPIPTALSLVAQRLNAIDEALLRLELAHTPSVLSLVAERLSAIDAALAQLVPPADVRRAFADVLETYNLVGQLNEVERNQRDQLCVLVGLAATLLSEARDDAQAQKLKRDDTNELLIQLRELGRKHVRGLADLERAAQWHETETERRDVGWTVGDADRRVAG